MAALGCTVSPPFVRAEVRPRPEPPPQEVTEPDRVPTDPNAVIPEPDTDGCHGLYAQELLPTFELEIAPAEWAALVDEWENGLVNEELEDQGLLDDYNPYHPLERFRYGEIEIDDAEVRLRGNPTWWRSQGKLQLQVSFNEGRRGGRFLGLRKLAFDAATFNRSFLRDRLALHSLRDAGLVAPCANHARLFVNGAYYGLFTNLEKIDQTFLDARFGDPDGDLWKRADWELQTNEETADRSRVDAALAATTLDELARWLDVDTAVTVAATEAVLPDADGFWAGGLNFYVYDDPLSGRLVVLPWDKDNTFWRLPPEVDPFVWRKEERFHGRPWYDVITADPAGFEAYVDELARVREAAFDPDVYAERIRTWSAQIEQAAFADQNKPWTNARYLEARVQIEQFVRDRAAFLDGWLACWQDGGVDDGTGHCVQ